MVIDENSPTFMGMPIIAALKSLEGGFAVVSLVNRRGPDSPDAYYHLVSWHPVYGVRELKIELHQVSVEMQDKLRRIALE